MLNVCLLSVPGLWHSSWLMVGSCRHCTFMMEERLGCFKPYSDISTSQGLFVLHFIWLHTMCPILYWFTIPRSLSPASCFLSPHSFPLFWPPYHFPPFPFCISLPLFPFLLPSLLPPSSLLSSPSSPPSSQGLCWFRPSPSEQVWQKQETGSSQATPGCRGSCTFKEGNRHSSAGERENMLLREN